MLEIKNLGFSYNSSQSILKDINVVFDRAKVIAIQGESGQGKSTLLSILSGLEKDFSGELILDDKIINKDELHEYNKKNISIIFQELNLINYLSIKDNIKQGCLVKSQEFNESKMVEYLDTFSLETLNLNEYPGKISGGQQQRIAIIRALLSDTKIILADEPTASIDNRNSTTIIKVLKKLAQEEGKTIIIVTHDDNVAKECDKTYILSDTNLIKKD